MPTWGIKRTTKAFTHWAEGLIVLLGPKSQTSQTDGNEASVSKVDLNMSG